MASKKQNFSYAIVAALILTLITQPTSHAASKSSIDSYYKKIYRELSSQGNNDGIAAMTYYDVEIKQAIGKVLDRKVKCDSQSKSRYKAIAFNTSSAEVDQIVYGFYLGYCNAR
jgi:hypothetical protein